MVKITRRKAITLMLAAIAGECSALLLVVMILINADPAGGSENYVTVAGIQQVGSEQEADLQQAEGGQAIPSRQVDGKDECADSKKVEEAFDIEAKAELLNKKVVVKENIKLRPAPGNANIYLPSANKAKTVIKRILHNGKPVAYNRRGTDISVIQAENNGCLFIEYEVFLDTKPELLSFSENCVLLTNFLAVPAVYRNSSPLPTYSWHLGDPYRYDIFSYRVEIKSDKSYIAYGPGKKRDSVVGDNRTTVFEAKNLRDFPVVLFKNANVTVARQGNTRIVFINSALARSHASYALDYAEKLIGPYPYGELFVVAADFPLRGMECSNMVFISKSCFNNSDTLKKVLYHEILHQWFYGIIGTDQLNEPFMDEGMVTFITSRMCADKLPATYDSRFMKMRLNEYASKEIYNKLAYIDASAYFGELERKMGNNFYMMLKKIYKDKKFKTLYFEEFKQYLAEFSRGN